MLVLSRQQNQRIKFPELGIAVEILEIRGSKVRVGVDAPIEVRILRDELPDHGPSKQKPAVVRLPQSLRHELRNTLNELSLMMHVYRKRLERSGLEEHELIDTNQLFEAAIKRLQNLGDSEALAKPKANVGATQPMGTASRHALIVDDNDNERELLAGFLRMCDYGVSTAKDGVEALDYLRSNPLPELILLDMQMPRCDGQAFLEKLRAVDEWSSIHVFVVSGENASGSGLTPEDGYTRWFNKPLDPRRIVEEVSRIERTPQPSA